MARRQQPKRVLVAEDEFLVYLALEEDLLAHGFEVVGPFASLADVAAAIEREPIDVALLDINLGGEMIFPVAEALALRNVPFLFLTGYASASVPDHYRHIPRVNKPYEPRSFMALVHRLAAATDEPRLPPGPDHKR